MVLFMRRKSTTSEMMKAYIADSLLILMRDKEFHNITIEEITARAGVNRSTYYRHFNSKEDIILYFLDKIMGEYLDWSRQQKLDFKTYLTRMFEHSLRYKEQMLTIYQSGLSILFLKILEKYFHSQVDESKPLSDQYKVSFYIGGIFKHFLLWFSRDMQDEPEVMTLYALEILPANFVPYLVTI